MLKDITIGQYYPATSRIHKLDSTTKNINLMDIKIAWLKPCLVIFKNPNDHNGSPGKKNIFITKVNNIIHLKGLIPFTIYFIGISESFITATKAAVTIK